MNETRYAILIGMNAYKGGSLSPLDYAVKDADDLKETLISHCRFESGNIYSITDSKVSVLKQINESYEKIKKTFRPKVDLLFFYFSGHGSYDKMEAHSKIIFEDNSALRIIDVLENFYSNPAPKNSYIIIDACESGGVIHSKGITTEKQIRVLNQNAEGIYLMFATESDLNAYEMPNLQNSYFTYYFLEAIKTERLYDEDGLMTIQVIDDYTKKYVSKKSNFIQIPVSETRTSGYKPFSFLKSKMKSEINQAKQDNKAEHSGNLKPDVDNIEANDQTAVSFEDSLASEFRLKVQNEITEILDQSFVLLEKDLHSQGKKITISDNFDGIENTYEIERSIIIKAQKEEAEGMDGMFDVKQQDKKPYNIFGGISSIVDYFYDQSKPDLIYSIYHYSDYFWAKNISIKNSSIYDVRGGLIILVYQTKFGFATGVLHYHFDWTGTTDDMMIIDSTIIEPYLLNEYPKESILSSLRETVTAFPAKIEKWRLARENEIAKYIKKAKRD